MEVNVIYLVFGGNILKNFMFFKLIYLLHIDLLNYHNFMVNYILKLNYNHYHIYF